MRIYIYNYRKNCHLCIHVFPLVWDCNINYYDNQTCKYTHTHHINRSTPEYEPILGMVLLHFRHINYKLETHFYPLILYI